MKKLLTLILVGLILAGLSGCVEEEDKMTFVATKRTESPYQKYYIPQFKVAGDKVYFAWVQKDENNVLQIWTATMNTDGTNFEQVQRTYTLPPTGHHVPHLDVDANNIYYFWYGTNASGDKCLYTAKTDLQGNGFEPTERRVVPAITAYDMQVQGTKIYYVWNEGVKTNAAYIYQIFTGSMDIDGSNWEATQRTFSELEKYAPCLEVAGDKIYYAWDADLELWTAVMNLNGTGFEETKRTDTEKKPSNIRLHVSGDTIYYCWQELDEYSVNSIYTAKMDTEGLSWEGPVKRHEGISPDFKVDASNQKLDYVFLQWEGEDQHLFTAQMNLDGTGFQATKRRDATYEMSMYSPRVDLEASPLHYLWYEEDEDTLKQIWTGKLEEEQKVFVGYIG